MPELLTVSDRGQVTIPQQFREKLSIQAGDKIYCDIVNDTLVCKKTA